MTMFHHHNQNSSCYTAENRCYVNANSSCSYGVYLNQSIFGTHNLLEDNLQGEGYESKIETVEMSTNDHQGEEAAESSSKDFIKDPLEDEQGGRGGGGGGGWLQLSIGSHMAGISSDNQYHDDENKLGRIIMQTRREEDREQQFVELDLLPNSSSNFTQESVVIMNRSPAAAASSIPPYPFNPNYPSTPNYHNQQDVNNYQDYNTQYWPAFRSSSSSSLLPPVPSYISPSPFQLHSAAGVDFAHHLPRFDFRVIDPPRRPHSGIWFTLQASQIQAKEPFLPQIPKSYLRIKDRQMTIRVIIKYLVNKLRLHSEAEIEIRCKGQQLLPFLTLQHVRDSIWNPRESSSYSSSHQFHHHLMVLHYGRTTAA